MAAGTSPGRSRQAAWSPRYRKQQLPLRPTAPQALRLLVGAYHSSVALCGTLGVGTVSQSVGTRLGPAGGALAIGHAKLPAKVPVSIGIISRCAKRVASESQESQAAGCIQPGAALPSVQARLGGALPPKPPLTSHAQRHSQHRRHPTHSPPSPACSWIHAHVIPAGHLAPPALRISAAASAA